jgi:hypothetical protein
MQDQSFESQVDTGDGHFVGNALRFATQAEAEGYVKHLAWRWTMVRETRVIPSTDPVTHIWHLDSSELESLESGTRREPPYRVSL